MAKAAVYGRGVSHHCKSLTEEQQEDIFFLENNDPTSCLCGLLGFIRYFLTYECFGPHNKLSCHHPHLECKETYA